MRSGVIQPGSPYGIIDRSLEARSQKGGREYEGRGDYDGNGDREEGNALCRILRWWALSLLPSGEVGCAGFRFLMEVGCGDRCQEFAM